MDPSYRNETLMDQEISTTSLDMLVDPKGGVSRPSVDHLATVVLGCSPGSLVDQVSHKALECAVNNNRFFHSRCY